MKENRVKIKFATVFDLKNCLIQINVLISIHIRAQCAPISELPSNKSTIDGPGFPLPRPLGFLSVHD